MNFGALRFASPAACAALTALFALASGSVACGDDGGTAGGTTQSTTSGFGGEGGGAASAGATAGTSTGTNAGTGTGGGPPLTGTPMVVMTYNVQNLFDTVRDSANDGEIVYTQA